FSSAGSGRSWEAGGSASSELAQMSVASTAISVVAAIRICIANLGLRVKVAQRAGGHYQMKRSRTGKRTSFLWPAPEFPKKGANSATHRTRKAGCRAKRIADL